jgi:hypothetical protein
MAFADGFGRKDVSVAHSHSTHNAKKKPATGSRVIAT